MRLKEREFSRKVLENFFVKNPHFKRCQVVDQFVQERPLGKRFIMLYIDVKMVNQYNVTHILVLLHTPETFFLAFFTR